MYSILFFSAQVNIGEPSLPIQLAQRGKANIVPSGCELVAGDHDFHVCNLTHSVTLLTDIKAHPDGDGGLPSLYRGKSIVVYCINIVVDNDVSVCTLCCKNCPYLP